MFTVYRLQRILNKTNWYEITGISIFNFNISVWVELSEHPSNTYIG